MYQYSLPRLTFSPFLSVMLLLVWPSRSSHRDNKIWFSLHHETCGEETGIPPPTPLPLISYYEHDTTEYRLELQLGGDFVLTVSPMGMENV